MKRLVCFLAVWLLNATASAATDPSCYGPTIKPGVVCPGEQTDPAAAITNPSGYAWSVFAEINQPAFPGNGKDARRVWETWKSADYNKDPDEAIYLDNGHAPKEWNVQAKAAVPFKALVPVQQLEILNEQAKALSENLEAKVKLTPFFIPTNPLAEEVRTNRPAFNFILANQLYNRQGQYTYASVNRNFDFPLASKEVKAVWLEATSAMKVADYYAASAGGKTYVLVAMHVITKDIPFWHWASFVHKDQNKDPTSGYSAPLAKDQAVPKAIQNTPFANYRLIGELAKSANGTLTPNGGGAQVDWITRTGEPTVIGNPHIESGFEEQSSCITCHSHSSIGRRSDGGVVFNKFGLDVGAVNPSDFNVGGTIFYPLDFLWSLRNSKNYQP